jgi:hypothetical protein
MKNNKLVQTFRKIVAIVCGIVLAPIILVSIYILEEDYQFDKASIVTINEEFGEKIIIEDTYNMGGRTDDVRYLITTTSKEKIVDKAYWVLLSYNGKTIKQKQELSEESLTSLLTGIKSSK